MKSLLKPTLLFIAVVFCLLQFGFDVNSQVFYNDITPDYHFKTSTNDSYSIDLDFDGTDDCVLNFKTWENMGQAYHFSINPKGTTSVAVTNEMASIFEDQDIIGDSLT